MSVSPSPPARHPSVQAVRRFLARDARRHQEEGRLRRTPPVAGRSPDPAAEDRRALWQSRLAEYTRARQRQS